MPGDNASNNDHRDNDDKNNTEEDRDRDRRGRRGDRQSRFSGGDRDRSPRSKKKTCRLFVSNIPYEYRWQELKDLFRENVGEVSYVELFVDEQDKPRGCGIIEMANPDLVNEAIEKMHRHELKGRKLVVKEDNDVERDKYGRIIPRGGRSSGVGGRDGDRDRWNDLPSLVQGGGGSGGGGGGGSSSGKWGNTYGLSTQFLESLNITGPLISKVFVANLDYKVDDKKLREVFKLAGRVLSAEIQMDKEGKSRGFGVVEYEHPVEAVQAISMLHNQSLYDRRLSVRMDRVEKGDGLPPKLPEGLKGIGMGLGANGVPLQDVARNLPSNPTPQPVVAPSSVSAALSAVSNPALATAALVNSLIGGAATGAGDITSLAASPFNAAALTSAATANPIAAQFLGSGSTLGAAFTSSARGGGDFDSLSAALSGGGSASTGALGSSAADRAVGRGSGGGGGGGSASGNSRAPSDTIVLTNLPPGTTWQMLREKCRDVAEVKFAEMRGKDTGLVQFFSQWAAQRAINALDGMRVEGKVIDVTYY